MRLANRVLQAFKRRYLAFVPLTELHVLDGTTKRGDSLSPLFTEAFKAESLAPFVNAAFTAAITIGAMLAVLQLARAGFLYMGSDVWGKKEQGKQIMRDAVLGLLILLAIWLILKQINPQLLNLDVLNKIQPIKQYDGGAFSPFCPAGQVWTGTGCAASGSTGSTPARNFFLAPNQDPSLQGCNTAGCGVPGPLDPGFAPTP